jgi:hypothetical protein
VNVCVCVCVCVFVMVSMVVRATDFDELNERLEKAASIVKKEGTPVFYFQIVKAIDDYSVTVWTRVEVDTRVFCRASIRQMDSIDMFDRHWAAFVASRHWNLV